MHDARWIVAIMVSALLAGLAPAADHPVERDVTFFVMSDPHIGFQDKNQAPRSTGQIVGDGRRQVERTAGVIGAPYPDHGPLAALGLGNVAAPRGLLIAGDLTDNQRWDAFTAIFPPAGIKTATDSIPVFLCVGNHDGEPDSPVRRGAVDSNRAHQRAGRLAAISEDGMHYAVNWDGLHVLCLGLPMAQSGGQRRGGTAPVRRQSSARPADVQRLLLRQPLLGLPRHGRPVCRRALRRPWDGLGHGACDGETAGVA